jgi:hypothetical protein
MSYPPLLKLATAAECRSHYENIYCRAPIVTFDGIAVRFRKSDFNHCFFESSRRDSTKDLFSAKRAERMDWIEAALKDANAELYCGWDKKRRRYDRSRRVAVVMGDYVVIIALTSPTTAIFVTAFVADTPACAGRPSTIDQIRKGPKWTQKNR